MAKNSTQRLMARTADYFEGTAAALEAYARKCRNLSQRAALMREIAHHLECAARLRGQPIAPIQRRAR